MESNTIILYLITKTLERLLPKKIRQQKRHEKESNHTFFFAQKRLRKSQRLLSCENGLTKKGGKTAASVNT